MDLKLLNKFELNISEIANILNISRPKAKKIVENIKKKNKEFYKNNTAYAINRIAPIHLVDFLGLSREEFIKYLK